MFGKMLIKQLLVQLGRSRSRFARVLAFTLELVATLLQALDHPLREGLNCFTRCYLPGHHRVQVSNDFKRQIGNKNFARVPHEYMEYTEAADALRGAIKNEPADFKARVETRLKTAVTAYQKISDMSATATDPDKLMAEHSKAVTAMNAVFDLFPADFRPDPNLPPPGRGGRGAKKS